MNNEVKEYKKSCFIDCNTFLHYFLFTEVDWLEVIKTSSVLIIVNSTVLNELNKKKYDNNINIKHRAQTVIKKISEIVKNEEISIINKDLGFLTISKEPTISWIDEGLDPEIPDDRIIASVIEQRSNLNNVILVTSDIGLKLKALAKNIECISLPEKYLLKENNNEIEKLKKKIEALENKLPDLKLKLLENEETINFRKIRMLEYFEEISEDERIKKLKKIEENLEYKSEVKNEKNNSGLISALMGFQTINKDEIERYEKDLKKYIKELSNYYKALSNYKQYKSRLVEIKFALINNGNQPAEDVIIFIYFPDGFEMIEEDKIPEEPEEPEKPVSPRTMQELISNFSLNKNFNIPNYDFLSKIPDLRNTISYSPKIIKKNSYEVRYSIDKIKHGMLISLDPVYILFEKINDAKSFKIVYSILADNLPKPVKGKLSIIINNSL